MAMIRALDSDSVAPPILESTVSIREAARQMRALACDVVQVRQEHRHGLLTSAAIRDALAIDQLPVDTPIARITSWTMTHASLEELLLGAQHRKRIQQVTSMAELADAVHDHPRWVQSLIIKGIKVRYVGRMVRELDQEVFQKLAGLLATPECLDHICVLVMGSEGRGEQVIKTDQDNALIAQDDWPIAQVRAFAHAWTDALLRLGYPLCPGNVMLCNPQWGHGLTEWQNQLLSWMRDPTPTHLMRLAICYDARVVVGKKLLFQQARDFFLAHLPDDPAFYAHLARPVLAFKSPLGVFNRFIVEKGSRRMDLKKGGIFPLVHGTRVLAMEQRLKDPNTPRRLRGLMRTGVLENAFGLDLIEAFDFISMLRVKQSDHLLVSSLGHLERENLRECLALVERFKSLISHHFRLQMLQ